ncbi:MAG TPA: ribulose-phosphate 3-epimerase [Solirubrobacteraceae bacterium]|nr:ribulose-phosphate 3-epimerase [Solirubrobacteraceae bacterium]
MSARAGARAGPSEGSAGPSEGREAAPLALLREVNVAPSILSADFGRLREQVGEVLAAGARMIHVDVMDGHFVPPITVGSLIVAALAEQVGAVGGLLDVHLMIERPERHVEDFVRAGAGSVTIHAESTPHVAYAANLIREGGAGVGVAINPGTPAEALRDLDDAIDLALCMTVNPGWGGQPFIEHSLSKLPRVRQLLSERVAVEVDGGIDPHTAPACRRVGANLFVAGSAIFTADDPGEAYGAIAQALARGE